jgi:hypothetical protein
MRSKYLILSVVALAGLLQQSKASINLGSADSFAVLGASTVTSTGNTVLNGNLGLYAGTSITGFPPGIVNGTIHDTDTVAGQAQADALTAYNNLAGATSTENLSGQDLGGKTLLPGVYTFNSSAQLTGALTLSGAGDYIFQINSTLTTASASSIILESGALASDVFWQVGSSATLGTTTSFYGSILAEASISLDDGANILSGRALALTGAVTLIDNDINVPSAVTSVPEPATLISGVMLLLPFGAKLRSMMRRNQSA